jgi:thioredoxin-like negative regulator of GroEL
MTELQGDALRAAHTLRKALAHDPHNVAATVALAEQLADIGAVEDARRIAAELVRRHPEARKQLSDILPPEGEPLPR